MKLISQKLKSRYLLIYHLPLVSPNTLREKKQYRRFVWYYDQFLLCLHKTKNKNKTTDWFWRIWNENLNQSRRNRGCLEWVDFYKKIDKIWFWASWFSGTFPPVKSKSDYMCTGFYILITPFWTSFNKNYEERSATDGLHLRRTAKDFSEQRSFLTMRMNISSTTQSTAQKMKFSIKGFFSKCDQICRKVSASVESLMIKYIF